MAIHRKTPSSDSYYSRHLGEPLPDGVLTRLGTTILSNCFAAHAKNIHMGSLTKFWSHPSELTHTHNYTNIGRQSSISENTDSGMGQLPGY